MNGWLIAALAGLLGGGACRTARLRPPIDLGGYASHLPLPAEIATPPAIVRVHVPQGWRSDAPLLNHGVIDDGIVYGRDAFELPIPELVFAHPKFEYAGAIYYVGDARGMDAERIRTHEVRDGVARNVEDPSLSRTRIDGRDAFIILGSYDLRETNLSSRDDPRGAIRRGDIAMAVVPLQSLGTNVVIIVVSQPGVLSRDPALALAIFASCRFREPASLVLSNVETATVNNFSSEPTLTQ
jgi:hypothetical protein